MEALAIDDSCIGKRSEGRTVLSVMASMAAVSVSCAVHIRNLSTKGGMIEGDLLPEIGEALELRRGELCATARIVWKDVGKAGLRFDHRITIADWLPTSHAGQQTVDNLFQQLKDGTGKSPLLEVKPSAPQALDSEHLEETAEALEDLADTLAADEDVVARHLTRLQILDIAIQTLRKLASG